MFSRLTQGVSSVLQELSGEEPPNDDLQDVVVPQTHYDPKPSLDDSGSSEEMQERLAQTEQLVVQLKELIREKDIKLSSTEKQLKEEKEQSEVKFTKLKMQAKAKMASLNKQITELKGQGVLNSSQNSESSFQMAPGVEEELQQLKEKLSQAESSNKLLQQQLWEAEGRVREEGHAEQVRLLQAVVKEKDVRFQEQIYKHEQELLSITQASNDSDLQQALRVSQQRAEELEESLRSRSEVLEMLQQELNSADQQKQILTGQFRQMELELAEAQRMREEKWHHAEDELHILRVTIEALTNEKDALKEQLLLKETKTEEITAILDSEVREKSDILNQLKSKEFEFEAELVKMRDCLEVGLKSSEKEKEETIHSLNSELVKQATRIDEMEAELEAAGKEKEQIQKKLNDKEKEFDEELVKLKSCLEERLVTSESEKEQSINALSSDLLEKAAELNKARAKVESETTEKENILERFRKMETEFEAELTTTKTRMGCLEISEVQNAERIAALNSELLQKTIEIDEIRVKLEIEESEKAKVLGNFRKRESEFEAELGKLKSSLQERLETSESGKEQIIQDLNFELQTRTKLIEDIRVKLDFEEEEKKEVMDKMKERECYFEEELDKMKSSLEERLKTSESEKEQIIQDLKSELLEQMTKMNELRAVLESEEQEKKETMARLKEKEIDFEAELVKMKSLLEARLELSEGEKEQTISALNCDLQQRILEINEMRATLEFEEREKTELLDKMDKRETELETKLAKMESELKSTLSENMECVSALNSELMLKATQIDELKDKLYSEETERLKTVQERQTLETELANLQSRLDSAEIQKEELTKQFGMEETSRIEERHHFQETLKNVERERAEESLRDHQHQANMQSELDSLKEKFDANAKLNEEGLQVKDVLEKLWRGIQFLTAAEEEEMDAFPTSPAQFLEVLPTLETRLNNLKGERQESQAQMSQITFTLQSLQDQLHESTVEGERAAARIRHLEQQLGTFHVSNESLGDHVTDMCVTDLDASRQDEQHFLEQQLAEGETEFATYREKLSLYTYLTVQTSDPDSVSTGDFAGLHKNSTVQADSLEDSAELETTLVAMDTSVLSVSAGIESSPELLATQPESPGESKGTSSDEMVTSSDSEVAHSSWTLLEAVNQECSQDWSQSQEFASLRLSTQSWEENCEEPVTSSSCLVGTESPSLTIGNEEVCIGQQEGSLSNEDPSTSQNFENILAQEVQKKYSELLGELQLVKDSACQSQEKINELEEQIKTLTVSKNEAESKAGTFERELIDAKDLMQQEKLNAESVTEQFENLQKEAQCKYNEMQVLLSNLEEGKQNFLKQEGEVRILAAQLEDRVAIGSQLEQKNIEMEGRLLQISQEADMTKSFLIDRTAELEGLRELISKKDQEILELNGVLTANLLQVEEEKFAISSEVTRLKDQIQKLEMDRIDQTTIIEDQAKEFKELDVLRKEKDELMIQMASMKKDGEHVKRKLQAALIQRKELMRKVTEFEKEAESREKVDENEELTSKFKVEMSEKHLEIKRLESLLQEARNVLDLKEKILTSVEQKVSEQEQTLSDTHSQIQHLTDQYEKMNKQQMLEINEDKERLLSQMASMETEIKTLQQEKNDYKGQFECLQAKEEEKTALLDKISELEHLIESQKSNDRQVIPTEAHAVDCQEKPQNLTSNLVQEDWVGFTSIEKQQMDQSQGVLEKNHMTVIKDLQENLKSEQTIRAELEMRLQEQIPTQSPTEDKLKDLWAEIEKLKKKERLFDSVTEEMEALQEKSHNAEVYAEKLKAELNEALEEAKRSILEADTPVRALQSEVEEFKQFLKNKNDEIVDLSQQLCEQNSVLLKMQETILEKDQAIASLQHELKAEQTRVQKLESELPQREEEKVNTKLQQVQRKLQAALVSRKEALKENQVLKEDQAAAERARLELQQRVELVEIELSKSKEEREKLIEEVDRTLLENQSLSASCESLKLAMEGVLNEKDSCKRQAESTKQEAEQTCRQLEEKVQSMKEEYETLLKSYENVSDEAERVGRVLESARQERQELVAKVRAHEIAKQEAEMLAEDAAKEVDVVKEKMRKFAKAKHQKIMDLEEENERLREQEEKMGNKLIEAELKEELEKVKEELEALKSNYNLAIDDKTLLENQIVELKCHLHNNDCETIVDGALESISKANVPVQLTSNDSIESQKIEGDGSPIETIPSVLEQEVTEVKASTEIVEHTVLIEDPEIALKAAYDKNKELEDALENQMCSRSELESTLNAELVTIKQQLQESLEREGIQREEIFERESQLHDLRIRLETERDDLEESLMNQMAQLNGSIAGYQQEAVDCRDHLTDTQCKLEMLEKERADFETELAREKDRACRMEEDMRQALRERAEAEAEAGKQRELEQRLKSAQKFKEGSQNRTRQLEELLREKQLEVRQMQKDCIEYQERISEMAKEVKSLLLGRDELQGELEAALSERANIVQENNTIQSDLTVCKEKLDVALGEVKQILADKIAIEQAAQIKEKELKEEAERTLDEVRYRLGAELKQLELRLENSYQEREREEEATLEARNISQAAERHAQEMQDRLEEALARLAAFSRSMSSLQDDRDRVMDEAKQWESRFHSQLQEKDAVFREAESRAKELAEQLQGETTAKEELQSILERTQKTEESLQLELCEIEKKHMESLSTLQEENRGLRDKLALVENNLALTSSQLTSLEKEAEGLRHRSKALEEAVDKLQSEAHEARAMIKEREAEEKRLFLKLEQLETDLASSKNLTETLQFQLDEKEKRELELLGEKEQAVTQAVEEARKDANERAEIAEKELVDRKENMRALEEKLHNAEEDMFQSRAQLESFTKAMGSLQDDRDRVLSQYKQLEERHLQVMMEKDSLIQEAAGENNGLKEELRALLSQRDDLYAENAKLSAQLHSYRDDLKQVLALKDSQHKHILTAHVDRISHLEKEKENLESHIHAMGNNFPIIKTSPLEQEMLTKASEQNPGDLNHDAPGAEIEKLREQLQAAKKRITTLEETLETEKEAQAVHSKELKELRWEGGILRTETETAEERVAELARDLLMMEQQLLEEREAAAQLRAQNQSFGQAMASLQIARDQAISDAKELRLHLEDVNQSGHTPGSSNSKGEVWSLKNALSALQNDRERMLEQLHMQQSELNRLGSGELSELTQTLEEEKRMAGEREKTIMAEIRIRDDQMERYTQELEMLRQERMDWQGQAELLKQQTLTTLSNRDHQIHQLTAMLEEARSSKLWHEHTQRQESLAVDAAPGGPLEHSEGYKAEYYELQRRLDEESELRLRAEEQLSAAQERLQRYTQGEWRMASEQVTSETAVLIEPTEGAVTRTRSGGPGLLRMLRVAFCSRQRTPLLLSLYLLMVHVLLLLCMGGFL